MASDFFRRQEAARRSTRWLLVLFLLAVLAIVSIVNLLLLWGFHGGAWTTLWAGDRPMVERLSQVWSLAGGTIGWASAILLGTIGFFSLAMTLKLRRGGAVVARELDARPVPPATEDAQERLLRNVVEEMALASGLPVPGVYVMDREPGINAFAAGFGPEDAVVAVTRGALEKLDRDELQAVVAHEFSHIFNGDTRLNMHLLGVLHGLEAFAVLGRVLMRRSVWAAPSRRNPAPAGEGNPADGAAVSFLLGAFVFLFGQLGAFFGALIKAAICRQRERLADASAVQYTRQPEGLAGALSKIAVGRELGSALVAGRRQEVSHMLFAHGLGFGGPWLHWLATHPPVEERLRALDPRWSRASLESIRRQLERRRVARREAERRQQSQRRETERTPGSPFNALPLAADAGLPGVALWGALAASGELEERRLAQARALLESLPAHARAAAQDPQRAPALALALLLSDQAEVRQKQQDLIGETLGDEVLNALQTIQAERDAAPWSPGHRLPLLELALPALNHQPETFLQRWLLGLSRVIGADGRVAFHEYALGRMARVQVQRAVRPREHRAGRLALHQVMSATGRLFAGFTWAGHPGNPEGARAAYQAAMTRMLIPAPPEWEAPEDWVSGMDEALRQLDGLRGEMKQTLLEGLAQAAIHAGRVTVAEAELVRAIALLLGVPVPLLLPFDSEAAGDRTNGPGGADENPVPDLG